MNPEKIACFVLYDEEDGDWNDLEAEKMDLFAKTNRLLMEQQGKTVIELASITITIVVID